MKLRIAFFTALITLTTLTASALVSEIRNYNYVCMHITKPEALVFKTSSPQKIWRTSITADGRIKKGKAFQLATAQINAENINADGKVASFKAELAKNYQIRGLFQKDTDGELPLTVVSTYLPDGITSQIKDRYNCEVEQKDKIIKLGSVTRE